MPNQMHLIDRLYQILTARQAITGLLQACESASDAGMFVQLHQLGGLLELLDEMETQTLTQLNNPVKQVA
ncbi:MAG: hypothetical protein AB7D03_03735 [Thiomicrospira sp.]